MQRIFPINDQDTYKSLLEISYKECANILYDSIKKIQTSKVLRIKQNSIDSAGSYCRRRVFGDEFINWNQTSRQIFNFIRAISNPGPSAQTHLNGKIIKINNAKICKKEFDNNFKPGEIIKETSLGYLVGCNNSIIEIQNINVSLFPGQIFKSF